MNEKILKLYWLCRRWKDLRTDWVQTDDSTMIPAIARVERDIYRMVDEVTNYLDARARAVEPQIF